MVKLEFRPSGQLSRASARQLLTDGYKYCSVCHQVLPLSEYRLVKGEYRSYCKDCTKKTNRKYASVRYHTKLKSDMTAYREQQKQKYVEKLGGKCCKCGHREDDYLGDLEFHHVLPSKKLFNPGFYFDNRYKGRDESEIESEIDKCALLCSNCHKRLTDEEQRGTYKWIFVRCTFGWNFLCRQTGVL